jgi:UDP-N-acetylglucosamine 2-epimerase (non-hydrolysing)
MNKKTVVLVVGTRPEAIKIAPLYRELSRSEYLTPQLLSTGQHREMLSQALKVFGLIPDHDLALMQSNQSLADLTARALSTVSKYLQEHKPSAVIVQGDTTSVFSSAIAAFYSGVPIGHLEAGLRTGNMHSPWPEEMNRKLVSPLCQWNFAPTTTSAANLVKEGIGTDRIFVCGNTVVDALLWGRELTQSRGEPRISVASRIGISERFFGSFMEDESGGQVVLVTAHRRESYGAGFENICKALIRLVDENDRIGIVLPVHLNPNVRDVVKRHLGTCNNISLIEPVDYLDMIWLMDNCRFIISDSGGIQEEAPSLGKPILVTRDTTERPEGVAAGTSRLVGTSIERIFSEANCLIHDIAEYEKRSSLKNPYGDGLASPRVRLILEQSL